MSSHPYTPGLWILTCTVHHVRRLFPPRLPLALHAQGCLRLRVLHRRHLLLPVRPLTYTPPFSMTNKLTILSAG